MDTLFFMKQPILPAVKQLKDFEKLLNSSYEYMVMLDVHVSQLRDVFQLARQHKKQLLLHVDLIRGLQSDIYGTQFLCQEFRPFGLLSTKSNVIIEAKARGIMAIQRVFLIDNNALTTSAALLAKTKPDYIEVLPAAMLNNIKEEIDKHIHIPIWAGGFVQTVQDVETALNSGALVVTTSNKELWNHYEKVTVMR